MVAGGLSQQRKRSMETEAKEGKCKSRIGASAHEHEWARCVVAVRPVWCVWCVEAGCREGGIEKSKKQKILSALHRT